MVYVLVFIFLFFGCLKLISRLLASLFLQILEILANVVSGVAPH